MKEQKLQELIRENEQLRIRMQEAEETIEAIRAGAVDAVVVQGPKGEQIFTLSGEDVVYRRLVETMNEAGLTVTPDGVVLFCNERFGEMIGKPLEEIMGRPLRNFLETSSQGVFSALLGGVQARPARQRLVFRASDAAPVPALVSASILRQADFVSVCLVATDMTELEESEETVRQINEQRNALREAHQRLTLAVGAGNIGLFDWHMQEEKVYCTGEYRAIYGYKSDSVENIVTVVFSADDFFERVFSEDRPRVRMQLQRAMAERKDYRAEHRILWTDGAVHWVEASGVFHYDEHGKAVRMLGAVLDITERKRGEDALRDSEEKYRTLFNAMDECYCIIEMVFDETGKAVDYRFIETNPSFEKHTGFKADRGQCMREIAPDHEDQWFETYGRVAMTGQAARFEQRAEHLKRWFDVYAYRYGEPKDRQVAVLFNDITGRKRAEEDMRRLNESLEQLVRDRTAELHYKNRELERRAEQLSRFASEVTLAEQRERHRLAKVLHDHLQQLLVAAKLGLQGLGQSLERREHTDAIYDIYELIKQSIEASRSLTVELSPTILHEAGLPAGLDWLARWTEKKHGLIVDLQVDDDADTDREDIRILMFESVRELLFNIVKHAGVTHAEVRLARRGENIEIVVSDEGMGFDPERLGEMGGESGGGYGLFSIRERLELLGGGLEIESQPHGGSRFKLTAPAVRGDKFTKEESRRARETEAADAATQGGRQAMMRVLIVDDHKVIRQGMAARLRREPDIEIAGEAGNGEEAISKAHELRPDVILMDFSMPRMDGVEATRKIHAELPDIRIIGLSMYEEADRARAMLEAGAAGYVTKSAELEELLAAIRTAHHAA